MPGFSSGGVFLSYRREDAGPYARSLQLQFSQRIPDAPVFMDLDSIEPGLDFAEVIEEAVNSSAVLVALIGRQWATLTDQDGVRRLDNPDDYVRFEVRTALERGVRVIPVLIDGATPLRQQELPAELHKLARLNALKLSYDRYQDDADRLLDLIQRVLAPIREREETERRAHEEADRKARQAEQRKARQAKQRKARQAEQRKVQQAEAQRISQQEAALEELEAQVRPAKEAYDALPWDVGNLLADGREHRRRAALVRDHYAALLLAREQVSGPEDPVALITRANLAYWTRRAGDADGARDRLAALLPTLEQVLGPQHPATLEARDEITRIDSVKGLGKKMFLGKNPLPGKN